jgi:hypothetical protein
MKNDRIKNDRIKSDRMKNDRIKSNCIKTDRIKSITDPARQSLNKTIPEQDNPLIRQSPEQDKP